MLRKWNRASVAVSLIFIIFAVIQCSTFIMAGDDFWWAYIPSVGKLFGELDVNGRYLTNCITYYIAHYPILRPIVCIPFFVALYYLMSQLLTRGIKDRFWSRVFTAVSIMLTPTGISVLTTNWISGFTNYVISIVFSLIYVIYCIPLFDGRPDKRPVWLALPFLILGFAGAFCVENISIYNVFTGLFFIIYSLARFRKVHPSNIAFFIGAAAGIFIMLQDKNYSQIVADGDDSGLRAVEIDFSNILMTFYVDLLPYIARIFFIVHIIIAVSVTALYFRKYHSLSCKGAPKYAKLFLPLICVYAIYSVYSETYGNLTSMTMAFRMNSIEVAFAFMYLFALIYMAWTLFDRNKFVRVVFFLCSIVVVTAPFLVVKPVTSRCFFATYLFWVLSAGEFLLPAIRHRRLSASAALRLGAVSAAASLTVILSVFNITNFICDRIRVDYIREQLAQPGRTIELITLPYPFYSCDTISFLEPNNKLMTFKIDNIIAGYSDLMFEYWGITDDVSDKNFIEVTIRDYFTSHSDE